MDDPLATAHYPFTPDGVLRPVPHGRPVGLPRVFHEGHFTWHELPETLTRDEAAAVRCAWLVDRATLPYVLLLMPGDRRVVGCTNRPWGRSGER